MKKLNFGCGRDYKEGWDNCDIQAGENIIYCDMNNYPYPFKDNTYDYILAKEVSGHAIEQKKFFMELWRIAKHGAIIELENTWYNNKGAWTDFDAYNHGVSDIEYYSLEKIPYQISNKSYFKVISLKLIPSKVGRFLPITLVKKLDLFISGLISKIKVKLKVIKK